jgi:hypothetical protein
MILKIFWPKNLAKNWRFFLKLCTASFCKKKKSLHTLVFEKNAHFFTENWQKSKKFIITTSTPSLQKLYKLGRF